MQNRKYTTKEILEVGLMAAIIIILNFIIIYVPILGAVISIALPLPVVILYVRHNGKIALLTCILSFIVMLMFIDPIRAIISSISILFLGITLGYCIKHKRGFFKTLLYQTIAGFIQMVIGVYIYMSFIVKTSLDGYINIMFIKPFKESIAISKGIYEGLGIDITSNPTMTLLESLDARTLLIMIPAVIIIILAISAYINIIIANKVLKRLGYEVEEPKPFTKWYFDDRVAAGFIIAICLSIILNSYKIPLGEYLLPFSVTLFQFMLLIDGLSLIFYYLEKRFNNKKGIKTFVVIMLFIIQPFILFVAYLGLGDIFIDLREINPNSLRNTFKNRFKK
ncbi:membrane protein [Clostridium putrefaciens]|uniref:Membrane protein n=1 Tax=Clostridium putrefaciens TaxID=99675 RepID=A0A381JBY5_9CLOT|nr:YybS family protein [Clostridium putrefaciens]SUY48529.1 membrane protein [Clostridium putrefaciens]